MTVWNNKVLIGTLKKEVLAEVFSRIRETCRTQYHTNPELLKEKIRSLFKEYGILAKDIIVTGETENLTTYIFQENSIIVFMPFQKLKYNPVLKEFFPKRKFYARNLEILPRSKELERRLSLPKIVLINPYIIEKYPIPRLSLSVSILASYLRKYQKAHVWILDMQLGLKIKDIEAEIFRIRPDIVGVSIPHGQTPLAVKILDRIYQLKRKEKWNGLVVVGNFIAASFPNYFLRRYPGIIIARGEGENTMIGLADFVKGKTRLEGVSGIIAQQNGKAIMTAMKPVNMDDLPPPAFDTIEELTRLRGALTHEWNRGCFWQCSFCPRHHKLKYFRGMTSKTIISQLKCFNDLMNKFPQLSRHLYVADEETIGGVEESETKRLMEIARGIIRNRIKISFDAYTRIDQIYNPRMDEKWHIKRMKMWYLLKKAGLARIFVGIESGSGTQLIRYAKGITPEQSIMAIRILSLMGIDFRLGFIMFDSLMNLEEVIENILFLERDDVLMKKIDIERYDSDTLKRLFSLLHQENFIRKYKAGKPLCTRVSYMLAQLEVLAGCNYLKLLEVAQKRYRKKLIIGKPDLTIGKIKVRYLNSDVALLAKFSQEWIERNFEIMYAIKGLQKTAEPHEKVKLFNLMETHRKLSLDFLKSMVLIITKNRKRLWEPPKVIKDYGFLDKFSSLLEKKSKSRSLRDCLKMFLYIMENEVINPTLELLNRKWIKDTEDKRLESSILRWKNYSSNSRTIAE
ncbi:MAG: cobalamin-dependent protein [Thermoproteota archaeon]